MKKATYYFNIFALTLAVVLFSYLAHGQSCSVTFQADLTAIKAENPGIRGNMEPLSWEKSTPLSDPDKDGIYTTTVNFAKCPAGHKVLYKFVHGNLSWENESMGPLGNRAVILTGQAQTIPAQTWDKLETYQPEAVVEVLDAQNFYNTVTTLGLAKSRGVTPEALAQQENDFWASAGTATSTPEEWLAYAKAFYSASPEHATFKVLEQTPQQIKISAKKYWLGYFERANGTVNGVTFDDFWAYFKKTMILSGNGQQLQLVFQETGDQVVVVVSKK